jgi:Ni,Fe-hydrogenase III large subunit
MMEPCAPWPRHALLADEWAAVGRDRSRALVALWADTSQVYALLRDASDGILFVSAGITDGAYPALSPTQPLAARFERMIHDLWGHIAVEGTDQRPWLDHGRWPRTIPMSLRPGPPGGSSEPPEFPPADDDTLDQVPLGPAGCGITPAAHLRLTVRGEIIVGAEARLGYTHKGTLALIRGKSPRAAARFAARLAAEATVAHSIAFARATEAALGVEAPPRAAALRQVMATVEQTAAQLERESAGVELEQLRRAAAIAFGHRLMMDCVVPGGVAADIAPGGIETIRSAMGDAASNLPALPEGATSALLPNESGEGIGHAFGPQGEIWHWLRLDHGQIASAFLCDPGWGKWPALEAALAGATLDDAPSMLATSNLSSSGVDL